MALKTRYEKKSDIPKGAEEHYNEKDGAWVLDADYEDVSALKNAKEHEKAERIKAQQKLTEAQSALNAALEEVNGIREGNIPKTDVDALKLSYQKKYDTDIAAANEKLTAAQAQVNKLVLGTTVDKLALELFGKDNLVIGRPHVASRLRLEEENGEQVVRVIDADGKPSAATVADLQKEILQDKTFAGILIGSRAAGGGATGGGGGGGASAKTLSQMSEAERVQYAKEKPEQYRADLAALQGAPRRY